MPPKRKFDAVELEEFKSDASSVKENDAPYEPVSKKRRLCRNSTENWSPAEDAWTEATQWLRDIGGINNNLYSRFMKKKKGRTGGASNGTYYAAYVCFEKVRIVEGKKKTSTRIRHEAELPRGYPLERAWGWVFTGR
ncbi:hypothetical protein DFS33DRAFT_1380115 [Desarmillaria ectypa]|nr:hypothetical protein DFS33DRAFT_1380115 [Desarmillaria ectypa]